MASNGVKSEKLNFRLPFVTRERLCLSCAWVKLPTTTFKTTKSPFFTKSLLVGQSTIMNYLALWSQFVQVLPRYRMMEEVRHNRDTDFLGACSLR